MMQLPFFGAILGAETEPIIVPRPTHRRQAFTHVNFDLLYDPKLAGAYGIRLGVSDCCTGDSAGLGCSDHQFFQTDT